MNKTIDCVYEFDRKEIEDMIAKGIDIPWVDHVVMEASDTIKVRIFFSDPTQLTLDLEG